MSNDVRQNDASWDDAVPRTQHALDLLQTTSEDVATSRTIDNDVRVEAISTARQLAADLTRSGLAEASQHANDVVATLDHPGLPQPERLQQQVGALHASLTPALEE